MATSSCEEPAIEFNASVLQSSVYDDSDDGECLLGSPNVRAYVANLELQQHRQHRQLCRTDDIGKHTRQRYHKRPQPPCKTTTAVLKARHLRAASEDLSRSWKSTDHSDVSITGRSVAEFEAALINSANLASDQNECSHDDPSDDDISFRFADDRKEPTSSCQEYNVAVSSDCDENETERSPQCGTGTNTERITMIQDTSVDCLPHQGRHSSSEVDGDEQQSQPATDSGVDITDFTGDDVGYFSLPERRSDRDRRQTSVRSRSQSCHIHHDSAIVNDEEVEPSLTYSYDSGGSLCPGPRTSRDRQDVSSTVGSSSPEDKQCQNLCEESQHHATTSSSTANDCSDRIISDNCSSNDTTYNQHSDKFEPDEEDQKTHDECHPVVPSVTPAKLEPEKLTAMMIASFGRCDKLLCRAVSAVASYKTAVNYVSSLFPETGLIRQCAFDLTRSCQFDATSTGIQFLTLEAVREAAKRYLQQQHDEMLRIKETTDNEESLLRQLDSRVVDLIKCKTDSRQLEKYHQYVDEMESVTRLLLLLAGRLARLDNSTGHSLLATQLSLSTNRDELMQKFIDASTLKSDIDRRGQMISDLLASCLSADEFVDYQRLMVEKTRLRLQRQELEDWLRLAEQQLQELSVDVDDYVQDIISHC